MPEELVALAAVDAVLDTNGCSAVPVSESQRAASELSALLVYLDLDEVDTWVELEQWVRARISGEPWAADPALRAIVVSPLTGRSSIERAVMNRECEGVARLLAERGVQVAQTHLSVQLDRDPRQISTSDSRALRQADICVFLLDGASTGSGILLGLAHRQCAIVAVLAPHRAQLELSPLLVGMSLPHTLMRGVDSATRLASFEMFLRARIGDATTRSAARAVSQREWEAVHQGVLEAVRLRGGVECLSLPAWLSRERLTSLLEEVDSLLAASVRELEALAKVLGLSWAEFGPASLQQSSPGALTAPELRAAATARQVGRWSAYEYDKMLQSAVTARARHQSERVRAHLNLSDPEGWLDLHRRMSGT